MKKLLLGLLLLVAGACPGAIPHPRDYEWGTITVPENYSYAGTQKISIYWEKLKATGVAPEAIVMINGGPGMPHDSFHQPNGTGYNRDWFSALRTHFDIYYFDQRGTGNSAGLSYTNLSTRNYRTYGTPDICRDIEELRKNVIKKKQIAVLGESYGGAVALTYSIMYPANVSKLIIHDSTPSNAYFTNMHINMSNGLTALEEVLPGVEENMNTCIEKFDNGEVSNAYGYNLTSNDFLTLCLPYTYSLRGQIAMATMALQIAQNGQSAILDAILAPAREMASRAAYSTLPVSILVVQGIEMLDQKGISSAADSSPWTKAWASERIFQPRLDFMKDYNITHFSGFNVISRLGQIKAPTLVVVGETDFICPPEYAEVMCEGIPDCRLLKVKNAAHGGFIEQNTFVVGKIRNFLLNHYPGDDERITPAEELRSRSSEEAVHIWLEGVTRLGLTSDFLKETFK